MTVLVDPSTGDSLGIQVQTVEDGLPTAFSVAYAITDIKPDQDYVVTAEVGDNGATWRNAAGVPVITNGNPKSGVQVVVTPVIATATPSPTVAPAPTASPTPSPLEPTSQGSSLLAIIILIAIVIAIIAFFVARGRAETPPPTDGAAGAAAAAGAGEADVHRSCSSDRDHRSNRRRPAGTARRDTGLTGP